MNAELQQKLESDYPDLSVCYCECDDGWYKLIDNACMELTAADGEFSFMQIKEKYGALRMYLGGYTDEAWYITEKYGSLSEHVCESCGQDGEVVNINGWYRATCNDCLEGKNGDM